MTCPVHGRTDLCPLEWCDCAEGTGGDGRPDECDVARDYLIEQSEKEEKKK